MAIDQRTAPACEAQNRATIDAYEACALAYAHSTKPADEYCGTPGLKQLRAAVQTDRRVLEIGSGPGWDADWLETSGLTVRRTDAAAAFVDFQRARGKQAERLNVMQDDLGGPYGVVVALYVFQHIDRGVLPATFAKISRALAPGGLFLFSTREGHGEQVDQRSDGRQYYTALWSPQALEALLRPLGFRTLWSNSWTDNEGLWRSMLLRLVPAQGPEKAADRP
jgi:SAM-dependent methyltransferase